MTIFDRLQAKTRETTVFAKQEIYGVLTITEVCAGWHRHYQTVRKAINAGNLVARKSGNAWIISYTSVVAWWGKPVEKEFDDVE